MASSPLTLAMLGGGAGLGGVQDPAYLPASRHLALAQNLIGHGLEGSPTPWTGALARVLMAGLGAHELNKGEGEFADVTGQRQHAALDAINYMRGDGASPLASAITGPAPAMQPAPPAAQPSAPGAAPTPPPALASAVHQLESGGSTAPGVTGDGGAAGGVMQVHQGALTDVNHALGTNYTMDQVTADPAIGKKIGDAYLGLQYARFPGHPELALAAYNAGPTATANAVSNGTGLAGLPQSTQAYVTKGIQLAGGDAGAPALPQGGGAAPGAAGTPGAPPTGLQAPNVARAMQMMQRAQEMAAANPYNSAIQEAARMQIQQAQVIAGLDNFVPTTQNGIAGQLNARTNEFKPTLTGTPRFATGPHGETIVGLPGGGVQTLNNNVSGMKAGSPEQVIAELGPKVQAGTATPQEQANYATAATLFQHPELQRNPGTQQVERIPTQQLPPGMPQPGQTAPGQSSGNGVQTLTPGTAPTAAVDKRYDDFHKLETTAQGARDELQQAALLKQTMHELGSTGPATPFLANLSRYAAQAGVPEETIKKFGLPPGATETQAAALANALVMEIARAGFPQRITNNDLQFASSVKPNPGQPLSAADFLIDNTIVPRAQRDIERYGTVVNLTNPQHHEYDPSLGSLPGRLFEFDKAHSLSSYTPKLAGGAAPEAGAASAPAAAPASAPAGQAAAPAQPAPVPGARQAPDGNWYVADPKRPGKYLQVK